MHVRCLRCRLVPGEIVRIGGDGLSLEVAPSVGARVHRLEAFGHDLLRTPPSPQQHRTDPFFWGGYIMAPWCNRAPAGPFELAGRTVDLVPNFPDGTAIHGLVHDRPWVRVDDGAWRVDVPAGRWPWRHAVRVAYAVDGPRAVIDLTVENRDDEPMPAGVGWHSWFRAPVEVMIPAAAVFASNVDSAATPVPVTGPFDRRRQGSPAIGLDATWTDLDGGPVVLSWPGAGVSMTMALSDAVGFVVVAAPADVDAVAVEPQTHGPDGLRRLVGGERERADVGRAWEVPDGPHRADRRPGVTRRSDHRPAAAPLPDSRRWTRPPASSRRSSSRWTSLAGTRYVVGAVPGGTRVVAVATSGTVTGDRIAGTLVGPGADWTVLGTDGVARVDVRTQIATHDGATIYVQYVGVLELNERVRATLARPHPGDGVRRPLLPRDAAPGVRRRALRVGEPHRLRGSRPPRRQRGALRGVPPLTAAAAAQRTRRSRR